jgi:hypothetical protein
MNEPMKMPPLRQENAADGFDGKRVAFVNQSWSAQDESWRMRDRMVEENIRMIAGQHWSVFDPLTQTYLDPTAWMSDEERRWRQRPVFNRILPWFILTHSKLTENPPIVTFLPGPDRIDAMLAETMDVVLKTIWRESGMTDTHDRAMAWMIPGGNAYLSARVDLSRGPMKEWRGQAEIPLVDDQGQPVPDPETGEPVMVPAENVPFSEAGEPLAVMHLDGQMEELGPAHETHEGMLMNDVLSPLEVRGEWGPTPWHLKQYHLTRTFLTTQQVWDQYGVEVEPDLRGADASNHQELHRLLFGAGYFGASSGMLGSEFARTAQAEGLVTITTRWDRPLAKVPEPDETGASSGLEGMVQGKGSPGGRLCVVTKDKVLLDGPRPVAYPYTSPITQLGFVRIPGRPQDSTPQEAINAANRSYNRGWAQILEHRNLVTNPIGLLDASSGLTEADFTNQPGAMYEVVTQAGIDPVKFVAPPPLGADVYRTQGMLLEEIDALGMTRNSTGELPGRDASGELVKELRFDTDRYLGATQRRNVEAYARHIETWMQLIPTIWDEPKLLQYAGEDNIARTLTVMPEMFQEGKVNVVPDLESMLPEGRGERQSRIYRMYTDGMFGMPGTPQALDTFFDLANFPHMGRAGKVGGVDRTMAEHILGALVQGVPAQAIPYFDWYNDDIHLLVLENYMKAPEFLALDPQAQQNMAMCRQRYLEMRAMKQMQAAMQAAQLQQMLAPPEAEGAGGKPAPGAKQEAAKQAEQSSVKPPSAADKSGNPAGYPTGLSTPM